MGWSIGLLDEYTEGNAPVGISDGDETEQRAASTGWTMGRAERIEFTPGP